MTKTIKYPAWWPEDALGDDDATGASRTLSRGEIRAMDNEHIVAMLTEETNGREGNPAIDWDAVFPWMPIDHNINAAMVLALQAVSINFDPLGIGVGYLDICANKEFYWPTVLELAFSDVTLQYYDDDRLEQSYTALVDAAERVRAHLEAWDQ